MSALQRFRRDERGGSAVEFALVLPIFLMMLLGAISAAQLMFTVNSLHFAVEDAARCSAVNAIACPDTNATVAYAQQRYQGPDVGVAFAVVEAACGQQVSATGSFLLSAGVAEWEVPVSARACFAGPDEA